MNIELAPITSGSMIASTLSAVEILALIRGLVRLDDLVWDDEALANWYIEERVDSELQSAYREELRTAIDEAREVTIGELVAEAERRQALLGVAYPFRVSLGDGVLLEVGTPQQCLPQTACYLWLSLFRATQGSDDHLTLPESAKANIRAEFDEVFEIIAAYALLGRADGPVWYLGGSRSAAKLLRILSHVTRRVGSGTVLLLNQLQSNQTSANDAGVDVILVERQPSPEGYLVGATTQKKDRWKKIIGHDEILRFRGFFLHQITATFIGVLATPYERREDEGINCAERNCLYFHGDLIIELLGRSIACVHRETRHLRYTLRAYGRSLQTKLIPPGQSPLVTCPWA